MRTFVFHEQTLVVQIPPWAFFSGLFLALAVAALIVWRVTRRKRPPPLPRA